MAELSALKRDLYERLHRVADGADAATAFAPSAEIRAGYPLERVRGLTEIGDLWAGLRHALPDLQRHDQIFLAGWGEADGRSGQAELGAPLIASLGWYVGTFRHSYLGIPPTGGVATLRAAEVHRVEDGRIVRSYVLWDFLDLMAQAGVWPLPPSLGAERAWLPPATADGLRLDREEPEAGCASLQRVLDMHAALFRFDGRDVETMPLAEYWHERFMYYAAAGIGTARGLAGFRAQHQIPFLRAFPDRAGAGHFVRLGEGPYAVTGGWPSVRLTHSGGDWLGLPPTGKVLGLRVMDFYRLAGARIAENWVPMDLPDLLRQMGVDVFARLAQRRGAWPTNL